MIPLKEENVTINIRPYRYPTSQKDTIKAMVKELLDSGVIRLSNSPFSSTIVMVKKKYRSWRMCIDYRHLNKHTVKDKFPIPVIEEIIDELQGAQEAFEKLQQAMIQSPVLALPNFNDEFVIETDASRIGLGAVLQQNKHTIAYLSKTLAPKHQSLSTYEKELLAVVLTLQKWIGYLLDRNFKIRTDHFSLNYGWPLWSLGYHKKTYHLLLLEGFEENGQGMVKLKMTTAYHPQTDGQTKIVNMCLETYLRCMTEETPKDWVKWVPLAEYWYNTNYYSVLDTTLYEVVYGQTLPMHIPYVDKDSPVEAIDRTLQARE
nr:retrotransposon protein, putative, unclassified [Tanacetum cinerariifolium]